ncbi:MAG: hypothetical protein IPP55_02330 [Anaerolineales bacterium]|nr:hypothetical protein [Anaerolineales bacterium]
MQLEIFKNILWQNPQSRSYLTQTYRHLIYDNVEEDISCAHVIVHDWLPNLDSALLIYDQAAGYRKFLGGDPDSGLGLSGDCDMVIELNESFVSSANVIQLSNALISSITKQEEIDATGTESAMEFIMTHFHPEMLDVLIANIQALIEQGTSPAEIVVLSPYLSDSLRFSIADRLEAAGIPWRSNRPSRSLRDEPASKSLLTLSALAHPHWNVRPPKFDVAHALMFTLNTDLIRAQLLTEIIYGQRDLRLSSFEEINADTQERITYALGARYTTLRNWIEEYRANGSLPLDFFLRRLFGEVVSQPEFGFHSNLDAVRIAASLIESIKKFRNAMDPIKDQSNLDLGMEYITMLQDGVIAAQYLESWRSEDKNAVLVAPIYLPDDEPPRNLSILARSRLRWLVATRHPAPHPSLRAFTLLGRSAGRVWLDSDEVEMEIETLTRLTGGLLARCREKIFLTLSDLGAAGFEQRGVLLRAFQKVLINQTPESE